MMIALDIGNTNVTVGFLKETSVLKSFKLPTSLFETKARALKLFKEKFLSSGVDSSEIKAVYACSVVPLLNKSIKDIVKAVLKQDVLFAGQDVIIPLINRYRIPDQVGQDRLVNAYAGLKLYGPGLIIVDFGTAITFDVVSKKSEYVGGLIVPGLKLMQESLNKKTALLPYVELAKPIEIIGGDTVSSIRAGLIYGTACLCDGIIHRLWAKECRGYKVIATGGDVSLIKPHSLYLALVEDSLVLKGLSFIRMSQKPRSN